METRIRSGFWLLALMAICVIVCAETQRPKNVQVALRAKWPGTPLLLEAGELLSKEWKDLLWEFIEAWHKNESGNTDTHTARGCLKKICSHMQSLVSGPLASVFELSLTLRSSSPRLVLYQQLAEESLASFPLPDDTKTSSIDGGVSKPREGTKADRTLVAVNPRSPGGKCCWVHTGGALFFDLSKLLSWLHNSDKGKGTNQQPELFEFDHIYFDSAFGSPVAILYGALGTECFKEFHTNLVEAAKEGTVKYVVRPVLPSGCESKGGSCGVIGTRDSLILGGYGVELALKNMEYKAMDDSEIKKGQKGVTLEDPHTEDLSQEVRGFIFSRILERKPERTYEIMAFRDHLLSSTISDSLNVWELNDLGHQTIQKIVHASDPLQSMQEINQNFPNVVSYLSRMKVNESIKDEILENQHKIAPGKSFMAMNGALINVEDMDIFLLLDMVRKELSFADQFDKLKIPPDTIHKLLSTLPPRESSTFRVDFRSDHVHYINNLETDPWYKKWRSNIKEILMPVVHGQLRHIRKNIFHVVYVLDPASVCGIETVDMMISLFENNLPIRFGVILYSTKFIQKLETNDGESPPFPDQNNIPIEEDLSSLIIRLFLYMKENHGLQIAFQFLRNVNRLRMESAEEGPPILHHVEKAFAETLSLNTNAPPQDILLKLKNEQSFHESSQESSSFVLKLGLEKLGCSLLMNGLVYGGYDEDVLSSALNDELPTIQEQVYTAQINSRTDILDKFLSESGIQRYNPQIIADGAKPKFISLTASVLNDKSLLNNVEYLHSYGTNDDLKPVTHLLAVNVTSKKGVKLLHEAIRYLIEGSEKARLGFLFSSDLDSGSNSLVFVKTLTLAISSYSHKDTVLNFLDQVCSFYESESMIESSQGAQSNQALLDKISELADANGIQSKRFMSALSEFSTAKFRSHLEKETC